MVFFVKAFVGAIFAEYRKLLGENTLLKSKPITIDMRAKETAIENGTIQVIPAMGNFTPTEIAALRHAISDDLMKEQGWTIDEQGRIKKGVRTILRIGFVTAIKKVLENTATFDLKNT